MANVIFDYKTRSFRSTWNSSQKIRQSFCIGMSFLLKKYFTTVSSNLLWQLKYMPGTRQNDTISLYYTHCTDQIKWRTIIDFKPDFISIIQPYRSPSSKKKKNQRALAIHPLEIHTTTPPRTKKKHSQPENEVQKYSPSACARNKSRPLVPKTEAAGRACISANRHARASPLIPVDRRERNRRVGEERARTAWLVELQNEINTEGGRLCAACAFSSLTVV